MSCYNEYLDHDFKKLGFTNYVKMLDRENREGKLTLLSTTQALLQPPFFGKYRIDFDFAVVNPTPSSGKRPYIGVIRASLIPHPNEELKTSQATYQSFYPPLPNKQQMTERTIRAYDEQLRQTLAATLTMTPEPNPDFHRSLPQTARKRR